MTHFRRAFQTVAIGCLLAVTTSLVMGQPGGDRGGRRNQDPQAGGPGGGGPPDRVAMFGGRGGGFGFGLDEQQQQLFREALQKHEEDLRKLEEQLQAAQRELIKAVIAEEYVEKTVREKAETVAKIQTEMLMLRSRALATVAPTLRAEQRSQMEDSRFSMILLSGGIGGSRFAMGGGPGMGGPGGPMADPQAGFGGRGQFRGPGGGGPQEPRAGGPGERGNRGNREQNQGQNASPDRQNQQRPPR